MADDFAVKDFTLGTAITVKAKEIATKKYPGHILYDETGAQLGTTTDAADTHTDATAISWTAIFKQISKSIQLMVFGAGTAAAAQRTTLASDDPAVAVLGATTGTKIITDAAGTIQQYLRGLVSLFANVTFTNTRMLVRGESRAFVASATQLVRPNNTTVYSAGDSVSNNGTAGSVTALVATVSDTNDDPVIITEIQLDTNDTGFGASVPIRVYLYNSDPTASSGVQAGDNVAFSNKRAGLIGTFTGVFIPMQDGGKATCVADAGSYRVAKPASGAMTLWVQHQVLSNPTPSAVSTTIDTSIKGVQARA